MKTCLICNRLKQAKTGENRYAVRELSSGLLVLGDTQYAHGYCLFLSNVHKRELHELSRDFRDKFLSDMATASHAVFKTFKPRKLNVELLGNIEEHLHWHIIPRYNTEENIHQPYWVIPRHIRDAEQYRPTDKQLMILKRKLWKYI